MGNIIYWKQYEEPKKYFDPLLKREAKVPGEYVCMDERVEKFWFMGYCSDIKCEELSIKAMFVMKDGTRHEFKIDNNGDHCEQAEQFLKTLPQKTNP